MPASLDDLRHWLNESLEGGAHWVVIKCDTLEDRGPDSDCCYPVPVNRADQLAKVMGNGDKTMEVYDLNLPIEQQLAEPRAWHPPIASQI